MSTNDATQMKANFKDGEQYWNTTSCSKNAKNAQNKQAAF
jgi:hypothetical protein